MSPPGGASYPRLGLTDGFAWEARATHGHLRLSVAGGGWGRVSRMGADLLVEMDWQVGFRQVLAPATTGLRRWRYARRQRSWGS